MLISGALLTQHEDMKLKELEDECARALREFKSSIPPKLEVSRFDNVPLLYVR